MSKPRVALTFDAEHPGRPECLPGNVERILDALRDAGARATFFLQGRWARSEPDAARRIAAEGHLVGSHSHYHAPLPMLTDAGVREDILDAQRAVEEASGADPRPWFRCPFGAGHDDARVLATLGHLGYRNVHWDIELEDWEPWRRGPDIAREAVAGALSHGDGAVVLLHTWPKGTGEAIAPMLSELISRGASFVRIDELEDMR